MATQTRTQPQPILDPSNSDIAGEATIDLMFACERAKARAEEIKREYRERMERLS